MVMSKVLDIAGLIVVGSIIFTLVSHKNTSNVVSSVGKLFTGAIKASEGR